MFLLIEVMWFFSLPKEGLDKGISYLFFYSFWQWRNLVECWKRLSIALVGGFWCRWSSGPSVSLSHLLFADEFFVVLRSPKFNTSTSLEGYLKSCLGCTLTHSKSIIYPVNVVHKLEVLADIMCCITSSFPPTTYLGLPLGARHRSTELWNVVFENFEERFTSWQEQYLS